MDLNRRLIDIGQETPAATLPPRDIGSPTDDVAEPENEIMEENLGLDPMAAVVSDPEDRSYYQDDSDVEEISDWEEPEKLRNRLSNWALTYGISHIALSALLAILTVQHCDLPKDARTLLNTRRDYSVRELCGGLYHYIGIIEALKHTLSQWKDKLVDGCCLHLQMSVDGLPLFLKVQVFSCGPF